MRLVRDLGPCRSQDNIHFTMNPLLVEALEDIPPSLTLVSLLQACPLTTTRTLRFERCSLLCCRHCVYHYTRIASLQADEEAKKTFWRVMRGSEKVLRRSLGKKRKSEAKAMALALSAKDKAIADLSKRVEKLEFEMAQEEAAAAMREESIREELEIARSEAQTLQTRLDAQQKVDEAPAELAMQQLRKKVEKLTNMQKEVSLWVQSDLNAVVVSMMTLVHALW